MSSPALTVLTFARAREVFGFAEKTVPLEPGQTAGQLLETLRPGWQRQFPDCRIALDLEFADLSTPLRAGQTLALIPPVSGG